MSDLAVPAIDDEVADEQASNNVDLTMDETSKRKRKRKLLHVSVSVIVHLSVLYHSTE